MTGSNHLHIGLVNNMPDGALKATEQQFLHLLRAASRGIEVKLSLFALQDVPRTDTGREHIRRNYASLDQLWETRLDGLIITGAEPRAANLSEEPYWQSLTKVFDWAERNVSSTICSCLAAHAAVQHFDGISRRRLDTKCFGLFECAKVSDHALTAGVQSPLVAPHSRWNDLPEASLASAGYQILTRTASGSVDAFVKQRKSLFVFFQGHPEYEADTLLLEYRRDLGRYLRGERNDRPLLPQSYLDPQCADALTAFHNEDLAQFPWAAVADRLESTWRPSASGIYANWLAFQLAKKNALPRFNVRRHSALSRPSASL